MAERSSGGHVGSMTKLITKLCWPRSSSRTDCSDFPLDTDHSILNIAWR